MKFVLSFLFFSSTTVFACAQVADSAISTVSQNEKWMDELEKLPMKDQLASITKRLLLDTNVYAKSNFPEDVRYSKNNGARPLYVIGGTSIFLCNVQDVKDIIKLTRLVSESGINPVSILRREKAAALYGSRASAGVIIIKLDDKKKEKEVKELNFGTDCYAPYICGFGNKMQTAQLITTPEENQKWLDELKALSIEQQIKKISDRLSNDASLFAGKNTPKLTGVHPLFVVNGVPVDINEKHISEELTNRFLQAEKVSINILDKKEQGALHTVQSGVIVIQIVDKENKRKRIKR